MWSPFSREKASSQEFAHTNPFFHHATAARVSTIPHYGSPLSIASKKFAILTIVDGLGHGKQAHTTLHDGIVVKRYGPEPLNYVQSPAEDTTKRHDVQGARRSNVLCRRAHVMRTLGLTITGSPALLNSDDSASLPLQHHRRESRHTCCVRVNIHLPVCFDKSLGIVKSFEGEGRRVVQLHPRQHLRTTVSDPRCTLRLSCRNLHLAIKCYYTATATQQGQTIASVPLIATIFALQFKLSDSCSLAQSEPPFEAFGHQYQMSLWRLRRSAQL